MLNRLSRILLALVTAFVFSGQMEAAAEHCARLAHAAQAVEPAETAPCHETAAVAASHGDPAHHAPAPPHGGDVQSPEHCECIAALTGWTTVEGPSASTTQIPYVWATPGAVQFASSEPDPDLRPPRA